MGNHWDAWRIAHVVFWVVCLIGYSSLQVMKWRDRAWNKKRDAEFAAYRNGTGPRPVMGPHTANPEAAPK